MDIIRAYIDFEQKFFSLTRDVLKGSPLGIYDLKYISGSSTLRLFILKDGDVNITIDDCAQVDRLLSEEIEQATWIPDSFVLEVSSPGVYREITCLEHFRLALGQRVTINILKQSLSEIGLKDYKVTGKLKQIVGEEIEITTEKNEELKIALEHIKKAKVDPKFEDLKASATLDQ